ncbi:GrpB family protein [Allokutzneria sp. NRRL B-24872]|uniref:GrpB family protein n=1 Tax=Allokutzneria sp. NRRL B-24872 TaxID=1137961 RepID=UPI000A36CA77|nr:GrpB family protein [Allokutzneria sp. NRRL B-24872]
MADFPAWATEKAVVVSHQQLWADRAGAERARLVELLEPWLAEGVEHIGSTAVPGLAAKPIVDLMASVREHTDGAAHAPLLDDGWHLVPPELDERPWRRLFVRPDASGQHRVAHLHLVSAGHQRWRDQLAFRDALRANPDLLREYAALKRQLSASHGADREAYTTGKSEFVARVLQTCPGGYMPDELH